MKKFKQTETTGRKWFSFKAIQTGFKLCRVEGPRK